MYWIYGRIYLTEKREINYSSLLGEILSHLSHAAKEPRLGLYRKIQK